MKIVYLVGSLAEQSINRKLAEALVAVAPEGVELVEAPIKDLPFYNRDLDDDMPQVALDFKQTIADADAVIMVTPEYNRMFSSVLHNAIEWTSRPYGKFDLQNKPVATIGTSASGVGTSLAQSHLRATLMFFNCKLMGQPEGYIDARITGQTEDGEITSADTKQFLGDWVASFVAFVKEVS